MTKRTHTYKYESYIRFVHENIYLYTWRVIIDHIENVDKTEEDCDQETHTAGNNLEIRRFFWVKIGRKLHTWGGIMKDVHETTTKRPDGR